MTPRNREGEPPQERPPSKKWPDVGSEGPKGKTNERAYMKDSTLTDRLREVCIKRAFIVFCSSTDLATRRRELLRLTRHVKVRSPRVVDRMEADRGLRRIEPDALTQQDTTPATVGGKV